MKCSIKMFFHLPSIIIIGKNILFIFILIDLNIYGYIHTYPMPQSQFSVLPETLKSVKNTLSETNGTAAVFGFDIFVNIKL